MIMRSLEYRDNYLIYIDLYEEGIQQTKGDIFECLGDAVGTSMVFGIPCLRRPCLVGIIEKPALLPPTLETLLLRQARS